ncbi:MAG TPA: lipoprotein [Usitatibacter sp.]|nr:lipoprotein [Usitatibacter sp.]
MIRACVFLSAFLLCAVALGGCGQKGPLKLPDPAPKPATFAP